MRKLPVLDETLLDRITIAEPCDADWNAMRGTERVRHCASCKQNVYDISTLERRDAVRLIAEHEGRVCLRLLRRADGTLVTRDCRQLVERARRRGRMAFALALVIAGLVHIGLRAWGISTLWSLFGEEPAPMMMGAMPPPLEMRHDPLPVMGGIPVMAEPPRPLVQPVAATHHRTMGRARFIPESKPND